MESINAAKDWQSVTGTGLGNFCDPFTPIIMERVAELGNITKDAEANIKESIHNQSLSMGKDFCDTNRNVSENGRDNLAATKDAACALEKSIMENRYFLHENIRNTQSDVKEAKYQLAEKIDREFDVLKLKQDAFEAKTAENFCTVRGEIKDNTRRVLDQLAANKLDEKNEIIDQLRHENRHNQYLSSLASIRQDNDYVKQMVNSLEQTQRFSSKTVQFGAGNVAIPTQTANQG